jgi:hypothetical protein
LSVVPVALDELADQLLPLVPDARPNRQPSPSCERVLHEPVGVLLPRLPRRDEVGARHAIDLPQDR